MATLTKTVIFSKRALYLAGAIVGGAIIFLILTRVIGFVKNAFIPPLQTPAAVAFGKIPQIDLSEGIKPLSQVHYTVETISGDIGAFDANVKVFKIDEPVAAFGNLGDTLERAQSAGFGVQPKELSGGIAKFADPADNTRFLTINTISQSVTLESKYLNNPEIFAARLKSQQDAKNTAVTFFENLQLPIKDFPDDKIFLENYRIESGIINRAISLAATNLVKVIFARADIDSLPIINPNFDNPLVFALATDKKVVAANYIVGNIQKYKFSTYPLKDAKGAFDDLQNGKGALNKLPASNAFPIRSVLLGYLETKKYQPYLQPVYIFLSDDGLIAYVGAVSDSWTFRDEAN